MTMRFFNGGSNITFLPDMNCCVPSCGVVRNEKNKNLPFYTFPSDVTLCKEWLKKIRLNEDEIGDLSSLHTTLAVCYSHFKFEKGCLKLCINDETTASKNSKVSMPQEKTPSKVSKISCGTQTIDNEWIKMLKEELHLDILYGNHIQCRVCARISIQAVSIYSNCNKETNKAFYLQDLINSLMPIEVKSTDTKPLNICVHCIFKLKEYMLLFNLCLTNNRNFDLLNESIKSETNRSDLEKNQASEVIHGFVLDNDTQNTDAFIHNDDSKGTTKYDLMNKSNLNELTLKAYGFIKQETRQHVIKLVLPTNVNINNKITKKNQFPNAKVIFVKFMAKYIICHDRERIDEIHINKDELRYSKETIDQILKIIHNTMKIHNERNNSKIVPLTVLPLHLDSKVTPSQQFQTTPVVIDGKTYLNVKICEETNEILKESEPSKKTWECDRCGSKLNDKEYYTTHIKLCHSKPCHFCGQHISPSSKLFEHEKEHRKCADGFICHLCGHQFISNKSLIAHYKQHQNKKRICCKICNLQFSNGFKLRRHLRQQHNELIVKRKPEEIQKKKQKCSKCFLWLSSKLALRVHMRTHLPIEERMKICPTCNKEFINARRFKLHVETHGPCPIKCLECSRSFPSQEHLDYHIRCHKITEPVYCDICHRNFKSKITLRQHNNRIHQGIQYIQKKFSCVFCKKVFASKVELLNHRNMHTFKEKVQAFGGDEYGKIQCNECDKLFLYKSRLSLHKMYHHSSLCQHCGKRTTGNSINHYCKIKGSNALQFYCLHCSKRFSSAQRLGYHKRTHGINDRFQCTMCSKWFTKLSALVTHTNSHLGIRQKTCNTCYKIFKSISTLNNHIESNHKEKKSPNDTNDLNNQGLHKIHNSVPLPANGTKNNDNESTMNNVSDVLNDIINLAELSNTLSPVQDFNLSGTHEHTTPTELDFMTSMNSSITMPEIDSQDFLNYDLPHDTSIPQDMKIPDQQLESVDIILDLQSLYDE